MVYATTFGETITLGRYLESFPAPPARCTSRRASTRARLNRCSSTASCPVRELTPLAGQPDLSAQAALTALLTPGGRVLLTGGEEIGSWMRQYDAASAVGFAFALELGAKDPASTPPVGAVGEISWHEAADRQMEAEPVPSGTVAGDLHGLFSSVQRRQDLRFPSPVGGEIRLEWF